MTVSVVRTHAAAPLSLRARHVAVTRGQILEVAWTLLVNEPQAPFSHELIANRAGVGARTVYRHFPRRADLLQALWERVRDETKTRCPSTEVEIIPLVRETFGQFGRHEAVVRAALSFSAAPELRSRGSLEGRPAFRRSLAEILNQLPLAARRHVVAVCLGIWSAPFW